MPFRSFLTNLEQSGVASILDAEPPTSEEIAAADPVIEEADAVARAVGPSRAPALHRDAARWAAAMLYRSCQFLAFREVSAETVTGSLQVACPAPATADVVWSVDLAFRHLPELIALGRGVSEDDPLVHGLRDLARRWPLSSVGVADLGPVSLDPSITDDPALFAVYVDRVIDAGDASRLGDPRVRDAVAAAIGIHGELQPELAAALRTDSQEPTTP